jgi:2-C-methyl-D-erythritol 2,4-cyclodiphosphate synthase
LGITSLCLLEEVQELLKERKFKVGNLDSVIIAQEPMLSPFIPEMQKNIATALKTSVEKVNIKSSTTQGLGIVGVGEAICANTVTTIK